MAKSFQEVISRLPELTTDELSVVIAAAQQLRIVRASSSATTRGNRGRKRPSVKQKDKGKKGPGNQVSPYAEVPEYREFRIAEKELHTYLRYIGKSLKEARADVVERTSPILVKFKEAQDAWFRYKNGPTNQVDQIDGSYVQKAISSLSGHQQ